MKNSDLRAANRTYTDEELTPQCLAIMWDLWKRSDAEALKTRGEVSAARTRLMTLEGYLVKLEEDRDEASAFLEAYFLAKGPS